jgi:hypothetical protein
VVKDTRIFSSPFRPILGSDRPYWYKQREEGFHGTNP